MPLVNDRNFDFIGTTRVESRKRTHDFDAPLRSQVHDALWMLTQQLRVGEFNGEDAGSPLLAQLEINKSPIKRLTTKSFEHNTAEATATSKTYNLLNVKTPSELLVEHLGLKLDLTARMSIGAMWLYFKRLRLPTDIFEEDYYVGYQIEYVPDTNNMLLAEDQEYFNAITKKSIDGYLLYLTSLTNDSFYQFGINDVFYQQELRAVDTQFKQWFETRYGIDGLDVGEYLATNNNTWKNRSLEYQFEMDATINRGTPQEISLVGEKYEGGILDWYESDLKSVTGRFESPSYSNSHLEFIPTPIKFKGMPSNRWWQFDDAGIDYAQMKAKKKDIGKLSLVDFALNYAGDWFLIPYDVECGNIYDVVGLMVKNNFGTNFLIKPAGEGSSSSWERWSMFGLDDKSNVNTRPILYIPDNIISKLESEPIEEIKFAKDEMANLVWAIEKKVPNPINGGMDGADAAMRLRKYYADYYNSNPPTGYTPAPSTKLNYKITKNDIPEHWIPFSSIKNPNGQGDMLFRKSTYYRTFEDMSTPSTILSKSDLLNSEAPFDLKESEILRPGLLLKTSYQRTRWYNGETMVWLGRQVTYGSGEVNSDMFFDRVENSNKTE